MVPTSVALRLVGFTTKSDEKETPGLDLGEVESGAFWTEFLRSLRQRGLSDVQLIISDDHDGLKAAIARGLTSAWQRCTLHFVTDMRYHCLRDQRGLLAAALREVVNAENQNQPRERIGHMTTGLEPIAPKVRRLLDDAEEDLIAFYLFLPEHWTKLRSTNPLERFKKEIGRRTDVAGIFPNDATVIRLAGALLSERNDEWLVQRRYLSVESMALILSARWSGDPSLEQQHPQEVAQLDAA